MCLEPRWPWVAVHAHRASWAADRVVDAGTIDGMRDDMRPLPLARPAPADLPPLRCPECGDAVRVVDDDVTRCGCGVEVGAAFFDPRGRRLPVRVVFATTTEPPCAACGGGRRRVLIGEDVGVACDGCGVLVRRPRRRHEVLRPGSRRDLVLEVLLVAVIVAVIATLVAGLRTFTAG